MRARVYLRAVDATRLNELITAGDLDAMVDALSALGPRQRTELHKAAKAHFRDRDTFEEIQGGFRRRGNAHEIQCAWLAVFATGAASAARHVSLAPAPDALVGFARRLCPSGLGEFVEKILPMWWPVAAALVEGGVAPRPPERLWALGMMQLARWADGFDKSVERWEAVLLRDLGMLFVHEGDGASSLSASGAGRWAERIVAWIASGKLSRVVVLDWQLSALGMGFATNRQGFFTALFDRLSPTADELAARRPGLTRLLSSSASPTVGWAMGHLEPALARGEIAPAALEGPLAARSASTAKEAVKALAILAELRVEVGIEVLKVVVAGIGHPDASVQSAAIGLIASIADAGYVADSLVRASVAPWAESASATVRGRLARWVDAVPVAVLPEATPRSVEVASAGPTDATRVIDDPVRALDDHALLDAIAQWVERADDIDRGECLWAAVATRARPTAPDVLAHAKALAPAWKRRMKSFWRSDPGTLLVVVTRAWALGAEVPECDGRGGLETLSPYDARALELAEALLAGKSVEWLSAPTHRGGYIDPVTAVVRWNARSRTVLHADLALAWLRLASEGRGAAQEALLDDGDTLTAGWRWALGGERPRVGIPVALAVVAAHVRDPDAPDAAVEAMHPMLAKRPWATRVRSRERKEISHAGGGSSQVLQVHGEHLGEHRWWMKRDAGAKATKPTKACVEARRLMPRGEIPSEDNVGGAAHFRATWPGWPTLYLALALDTLVSGVGSNEVDTRRPDVISPLLDDVTPWGAIGHEVLAAGLCSPHAAVRVAAVDLAIASITDGRFSAVAMADAMALLLRGGFMPAGRAVTSFTEVAKAGGREARAVGESWVAFMALGVELGRDLSRVIEAVHEAVAQSPVPWPEAALRHLEGVKSGKAGAASRALLDVARRG